MTVMKWAAGQQNTTWRLLRWKLVYFLCLPLIPTLPILTSSQEWICVNKIGGTGFNGDMLIIHLLVFHLILFLKTIFLILIFLSTYNTIKNINLFLLKSRGVGCNFKIKSQLVLILVFLSTLIILWYIILSDLKREQSGIVQWWNWN